LHKVVKSVLIVAIVAGAAMPAFAAPAKVPSAPAKKPAIQPVPKQAAPKQPSKQPQVLQKVTTSAVSLPMSKGQTGASVLALQKSLISRGFRTAADGKFGTTTATAVQAFQKSVGLKSDGVVGKATWSALTAPAKKVPVSTASVQDNIYVVRQGDTISSIASKLKVPETELIETNRLSADHALKIGQAISIPRVKSTPVSTQPVLVASPSKRRVVLTFDDSPDTTYLPAVVSVLSSHGSKATFFLTKETVSSRAADVELLSQAGHQIENHGQKDPAAEIGLAISETSLAIEKITGRKTKLFRPFTVERGAAYSLAAAANDHDIVMWSNLGFPEHDEVLSTMQASIFDGSVLRLSLGDPSTPEVLPALLEYMSLNGYECAPFGTQ